VEELREHAACLGTLQVEAHEARPREVGQLGVPEEELDVLRGDRKDRRVRVHDTARARDERHCRDVGAGVAPADQVLARPRLEREREHEHERRGEQGAPTRRPLERPGQPLASEQRRRRREERDQPRRREQAEAAQLRERERDPGRRRRAARHRQEQRLVERDLPPLARRQEGKENEPRE
jgi:hypothetical protein